MTQGDNEKLRTPKVKITFKKTYSIKQVSNCLLGQLNALNKII